MNNHPKLKSLLLLAAFSIPGASAVHADNHGPLELETEHAGITSIRLIKAYEYENTIWQKAWNTYLLAVSRKALLAGLPYRAYEVTTFEDELCPTSNPYRTQKIGNAIGVIGKSTDSRDQEELYTGITLTFAAPHNQPPRIADVCAWLDPEESEPPLDLLWVYNNVLAADLPPTGTWEEITQPLPNDARPLFKGSRQFDAPSNRGSWVLLGATPTHIARIPSGADISWNYHVDGEPTPLYLTTTATESANTHLTTTPLTTTFDWPLPPLPDPTSHDIIPILWTTTEPANSARELFLMTEGGLPTLDTDLYLDKALSTQVNLAIPE